MIQAKGKLKKKRRTEVIEEAEEAGKKLLDATPRRKREEHVTHFPTRELKNVIADTVERMWDELVPGYSWKSENTRRVNAEDTALDLIRVVKYGTDGQPGVKISEHEFHPRYCDEHRKGENG